MADSTNDTFKAASQLLLNADKISKRGSLLPRQTEQVRALEEYEDIQVRAFYQRAYKEWANPKGGSRLLMKLRGMSIVLARGSKLLATLDGVSELLSKLERGGLAKLEDASKLLANLEGGRQLLAELQGSELLANLEGGSELLAEIEDVSELLATLEGASELLANFGRVPELLAVSGEPELLAKRATVLLSAALPKLRVRDIGHDKQSRLISLTSKIIKENPDLHYILDSCLDSHPFPRWIRGRLEEHGNGDHPRHEVMTDTAVRAWKEAGLSIDDMIGHVMKHSWVSKTFEDPCSTSTTKRRRTNTIPSSAQTPVHNSDFPDNHQHVSSESTQAWQSSVQSFPPYSQPQRPLSKETSSRPTESAHEELTPGNPGTSLDEVRGNLTSQNPSNDHLYSSPNRSRNNMGPDPGEPAIPVQNFDKSLEDHNHGPPLGKCRCMEGLPASEISPLAPGHSAATPATYSSDPAATLQPHRAPPGPRLHAHSHPSQSLHASGLPFNHPGSRSQTQVQDSQRSGPQTNSPLPTSVTIGYDAFPNKQGLKGIDVAARAVFPSIQTGYDCGFNANHTAPSVQPTLPDQPFYSLSHSPRWLSAEHLEKLLPHGQPRLPLPSQLPGESNTINPFSKPNRAKPPVAECLSSVRNIHHLFPHTFSVRLSEDEYRGTRHTSLLKTVLAEDRDYGAMLILNCGPQEPSPEVIQEFRRWGGQDTIFQLRPCYELLAYSPRSWTDLSIQTLTTLFSPSDITRP